MAQSELILPKMGESVAEATITSWLINEGDTVELEDGVLEIATDKVDSEVPSTAKGILLKQLYKVGDVVKVGEAVAIISTDGNNTDTSQVTEIVTEHTPREEVMAAISPEDIAAIPEIQKVTNDSITNSDKKDGKSFYSPLVKSIAKKENISSQELESISGTGKNNRDRKSVV